MMMKTYCKSTTALLLLVAALTTVLLSSCHSDSPRWTNAYYHNEDNLRSICDSLAGTYDMTKVAILRCDTAGQETQLKANDWRTLLPDTTSKLQYIVGGYEDQRITIPHFPVSLIAPCIADTALARAVANVPCQNLQIQYKPQGDVRDEDTTEGTLPLSIQPLSLTLNVGGKQQVVELSFKSDMLIGIDAAIPSSLKVFSLQFSLTQVKIIGGVNQRLDGVWEGGPSISFLLWGERPGR